MKKIDIYTDGACSGNPGPGGCAFIIVNNDSTYSNSKGYKKTTNNRMEMRAVIMALEYVLEDQKMCSNGLELEVTIHSDSQLIVNAFNKGWSKSSNKDLWDTIGILIADLKTFNTKVTFEKVAGHAGDKWNEEVDKLAVEASKNDAFTEDTGYEKKEESIFSQNIQIEAPAEPEIVSIKFINCNTKDDRKIRVSLSNGTEVEIESLYGGFQQYNCTKKEAYITLHIAKRFCNWLKGGSL